MNDVISWLLEDDTPEIKYRTMVELLDMPKDDICVKTAYDKLMNSDAVANIMMKFELDKKWEDYNAFSALAEFGLTRYDVKIDEYVERIIANTGFKMLCGEGFLLRNLVALGYYDNPMVKEEIPKAFSVQKSDGGFGCISKSKKINDPKLLHKSCIRITASYLLLAAELKKIDVILPQNSQLVDYFIDRNVVYRHDDNTRFVVNEMAGTFYPLDPIKIGLQSSLYALAILGAGNRAGYIKARKILESKRDDEGRYLLDKSLSKPYFKIGKIGRPNKWITLYALLADKHSKE
jgi:hypothetical protein